MNPTDLWRFLPIGYLLTISLETPVLLVGLSRPHSLKRRLFAGIWLTACSYPIVILLLPSLIDTTRQSVLYTVIAETFAPVSECLLFYLAFHHKRTMSRSDRTRDLVAVTLANLFSFLMGEWLFHSPLGYALLHYLRQTA